MEHKNLFEYFFVILSIIFFIFFISLSQVKSQTKGISATPGAKVVGYVPPQFDPNTGNINDWTYMSDGSIQVTTNYPDGTIQETVMIPDPNNPGNYITKSVSVTEGLDKGETVRLYEMDLNKNLKRQDMLSIYDEQGFAQDMDNAGMGYFISEHGYPLSPFATSHTWNRREDMSGVFTRATAGPIYQDVYQRGNNYIAEQNYCSDSACTSGTKVILKYDPNTGQWVEVGREKWMRQGMAYSGTPIQSPGQSPQATPRIQRGRIISRGSGGSTSSYVECVPCSCSCTYNCCQGNCCGTCSATYDCCCGTSSCPSNQCSAGAPTISFSINPNRLFTNQAFTLSYRVINKGDTCSNNLSCSVSGKYLGANCDNNIPQQDKLYICSNEAPSNVFDPQNKLPQLSCDSVSSCQQTKTISLTPTINYWGNYQYTVYCTNYCSANSITRSVFIIPVLYYQEAQPFSLLFSPFVSLMKDLGIR